MADSRFNDAMIRRLEKELEERSSAASGIIANAEDASRDLNEAEKETLGSLKSRMGQIQDQLSQLEGIAEESTKVSDRMKQLDQAFTTARKVGSGEVEYRWAGGEALDAYKSALGDRQASERIEVFHRAAAHQKTSDNLGVIPNPILDGVINYIDAARPLVQLVGPRPMPSAT